MDKICTNNLISIEDIKLQISKKRINLEDMRLTKWDLMIILFFSIIDTYYFRNGAILSEKQLKRRKKLKHTPKIRLGLDGIGWYFRMNFLLKNRILSHFEEMLKIELYDKICGIIKNDYGMIIKILEISNKEKKENVDLICFEEKGRFYCKILINIKFEKEIYIDCRTDEKRKINDDVCKEIDFELFI